ncbi:VOC family protein [Afifella sp. IM 167]|uniref:VOC family protein n=1 Tax=Afifella sp. IM 167 TaxID=2033586 RepID=UPI001CCB74DC|nr:VOC family protein [Afifella sp. IM 167]MBZ8134360.1 glyoxalase [Afifella sp. IM 167]
MSIAATVKGVHHTALCVTDFERARDFFVKFVGFELEGEIDHRQEPELGEVVGEAGAMIRWALLRLGAHRIELFKYYRPHGAKDPRRQCDFGYTHLAFEVEDVDAVYARTQEAGYPAISPPKVMRGGRTKAFYLREPEGAVTEFIEFPAEASS